MYTIVQKIKSKNIYLVVLLLAVLSIIVRYPKVNTYNYYNSDATSHTLLTVKSYAETPISVHKFLPINTLGGEENKYIYNGPSLVFDEEGNSYYTSFSSIGFMIPYLFIKFFRIPYNEQSLYIFNSIIYILSMFGSIKLFRSIFRDKIEGSTITILVALLYLFQIEVMHSQGISFWVHSIFQLLLIYQIYFFVNIEKRNSRILFWIMCLVMPYIEWTGYISNIGFAIACLLGRKIKISRDEIIINIKAVLRVLLIISLTICSLLIFVVHFSSVIGREEFLEQLISRFMARNTLVSISISELVIGYFRSYGYLLVILIVLLIFTMSYPVTRIKLWERLKENYIVGFVMTFPIIENLIMKEHAISYSFDRLKVILPLIFVFLILYDSWGFEINKKKIFRVIINIIVVFGCIFNLVTYTYTDNQYRWKVDYLEDNAQFVNEITKDYTKDNSIIVQDGWRAWGYAQLLFDRNIYSTAFYSKLELENIIKKKNKQYIVYIYPEESNWDKARYSKIIVFDNIEKSVQVGNYIGDEKVDYMNQNIIKAASLTDENWINGVASDGMSLLFQNNEYNDAIIGNAKYININGENIQIYHIDKNEQWIRIDFKEPIDSKVVQYPNDIEVVG